ncbi:MAG: histone deacetylase family protein [Bacteroidia bacterium]|nr:MAG: histone deacetylase family protein [Bacteroidia bacterium]
MFRIRRILSDRFNADKNAIKQVKDILENQFPDIDKAKIDLIPDQLRDSLKFKLQTSLFVAESKTGQVQGFALLMYAPDLNFIYLDFIASKKAKTSGGIGSALYQRVKEESIHLGVRGLFFECLPDNPDLCKNTDLLEQNRSRLKFYERFGAFPLVNTLYETPVNDGDDCPPFLVCDFLGKDETVDRKSMQSIIRAILERKYGDYCPSEYVNMIVGSVKDDPVILRKPVYIKRAAVKSRSDISVASRDTIFLVVNDKHTIHHVQDRGYVESPVRIDSILKEIVPTGMFLLKPPRKYSDQHLYNIHDRGYLRYFKRVCGTISEGKSIYPYIFPIRNAARPPEDDSVLAGYYCIDTFTPLNKNAYLAARRAVDCALTCADGLLDGFRVAYALVRPPGHHAESKVFGGFCYFNSNAIAANYLSRFGRVAILDIDYHHGNGQQEIFYERDDVLTVSIHGHPSFAYPYFSGYRDEKGYGAGYGYNVNFPLKESINGEEYRKVLGQALKVITRYSPDYLVVALGLDTSRNDPTGSWSLLSGDFMENGKMIGSLGYPTLVVQEGGYRNRVLGINARNFFSGLQTELFRK